MGGGSYNYLYCTEIEDLLQYGKDKELKNIEKRLKELGYNHTSREIYKLIKTIEKAKQELDAAFTPLLDILKNLEWYDSDDYGIEKIKEAIYKYEQDKEYTLGLQCGGLMEDPEWHLEMVRTVRAKNLEEAKLKWAEITGEDKKETWCPERKTVWGWSIMVLRTTDLKVPKDCYFKGTKIGNT